MLIAISKYLKPAAEIDQYRPEHHKYIKPLFEAGILLVSGRQNPPIGAVIIAKIESRDEFQKILANDPFVKAGVAEYTITEFTPVFYHESFARMTEPRP